jgi:phosphoribosylanthranilate isomerase
MKIKICGITNLQDALYCEQKGVDALGFVFYEKSKRYIDYETAYKIINKLNPFTIKVGVFVNKSANEINEIVKITGINIAQLHGDEKYEDYKEVCIPILKAIRVKDKLSIKEIQEWQNCRILLDTYNKESYGGTGKMFDYNIIPEEVFRNSIIAGGINYDTIDKILTKEILPAGIDVSSGVEKYEGKKDYEKIDLLISKINERRNRC